MSLLILIKLPKAPFDVDLYGYETDYTYDLAGNRLTRDVTVTKSGATQTLYTSYTYDPDTDRLRAETQCATGPYAAIQWKDGQRVYVYAGTDSRWFTYKLPGNSKHIGQAMAFVLGLPSVWSNYLLMLVLILIPIVTFAPVIADAYRRLSKSAEGDTGIRLSLFKRCICVLLSYTMLLSPVVIKAR